MPLPHFTNIKASMMCDVDDTRKFTPYIISWDRFESDFVEIEKMDLYRCNIIVIFKKEDKFMDILIGVNPYEITIKVCDKEGQHLRDIKLSSNMRYMKIIDEEPVSIEFGKMEITEFKK